MSPAYLPGRVVRTLAAQRRLWSFVWALFAAAAIGLIRFGPGEWRWGVALFSIGLPLLLRTLSNARAQKHAVESAPAIAALRSGQPAQAEKDLLALRERISWPRQLRNLTSYNLALARHFQGRHADAIVALAEADRGGGAPNIDPAIASTLALCHGLLNNVELAQSWLTEARRRYAGRVAAAAFPELVAEMTLALRRSQFEEVRRRFDAEWLQITNSRTGETLNPLRILRAFAIEKSGGPPAEKDALINAMQRGARPTSSTWPSNGQNCTRFSGHWLTD